VSAIGGLVTSVGVIEGAYVAVRDENGVDPVMLSFDAVSRG